jgi:hypothetical protein
MRPRGRVGLHRAEDGPLDRLPHLRLGGDRRRAAVSHRRSHLQLVPQPHDAEHQHQRPDHHVHDHDRRSPLRHQGPDGDHPRRDLDRQLSGGRCRCASAASKHSTTDTNKASRPLDRALKHR